MNKAIPARFAVCAVVSGALCLLAAAVPQWLELAVGLTPDGGSGSTEWGLAFGFFLAASCSGAFAERSHRRARLAWSRLNPPAVARSD